MNIAERIYEAAKAHFETEEHIYIALRFEDRALEIGDICDYSRHNGDREDLRDFPEFGTPEFDEMEELDGTCCYEILREGLEYEENEHLRSSQLEGKTPENFLWDHAYIVASDKMVGHPDPDEHEILLVEPVVIAQIF